MPGSGGGRDNSKKLFKTNLWPAAGYGVSGMGLSPTATRRLATQAAICALPTRGKRSTTAIALELGMDADPRVAVPRRILQDWVWLWEAHPDCHASWRMGGVDQNPAHTGC